MRLFLFILLTIPISAQINRDLDIYKGDSHILSFEVGGDVSSDSLMFVVKADRDDDTPRVITRRNTAGGGDDTQIEIIYSNISTILVKLTQINTEGLTAAIYVYDLTLDSTRTLYTGNLKLRDEVSGSADGVATSTPYYTVALDTPSTSPAFPLGMDTDNSWINISKSAIQDTLYGITSIDSYTGANDSIKLASALAVLGTETSLYFPPGTYDVGTQTINEDVILSRGAILIGNLIFDDGEVKAGNYYCLDSTGTYDFSESRNLFVYSDWFGSKPNDGLDDVTGLEAAFKSHREVRLSAGTYDLLTNRTMTVGSDDNIVDSISIIGVAGLTILRIGDSRTVGNLISISIATSGTPGGYIEVTGITFDGNESNIDYGAIGMYVAGGDNIWIHRNIFRNMEEEALFVSVSWVDNDPTETTPLRAQNVLIENNIFKDFSKAHLSQNGLEVVSNNYLANQDSATEMSKIVIQNNRFYDSEGTTCIELDGQLKYAKILDNWFYQTVSNMPDSGKGIVIEADNLVGGIDIIGNHIIGIDTSSWSGGIVANRGGLVGNRVMHNTIMNIGGYGIATASGSGATSGTKSASYAGADTLIVGNNTIISYNYIENVKGNGIFIAGAESGAKSSSGFLIDHNIIVNFGQSGSGAQYGINGSLQYSTISYNYITTNIDTVTGIAITGGTIDDGYNDVSFNTIQFSNWVYGDALNIQTPSNVTKMGNRFNAGSESDVYTADGNVLPNRLWIVPSQSLVLDSLHYYNTVSDIADDDTITLPTNRTGWGFIMIGNMQEYTTFYFTANGTVTIGTDSTSNIANTDADGKLCIIDVGSGVGIKNRLAATLVIAIDVKFYNPNP